MEDRHVDRPSPPPVTPSPTDRRSPLRRDDILEVVGEAYFIFHAAGRLGLSSGVDHSVSRNIYSQRR